MTESRPAKKATDMYVEYAIGNVICDGRAKAIIIPNIRPSKIHIYFSAPTGTAYLKIILPLKPDISKLSYLFILTLTPWFVDGVI